jgi:hypothetical protein
LASAALGLARLKLWEVLSGLFGGRHAVFYSITTRLDRLPLAAAREVHTRIDLGGLGGKIVLLPWPEA